MACALNSPQPSWPVHVRPGALRSLNVREFLNVRELSLELLEVVTMSTLHLTESIHASPPVEAFPPQSGPFLLMGLT